MVKKILIVDDDPGVTHTVKYGLEGLDEDYEVIAVDSGEKCLQMLKNNEIPDLILLDIMMPEMSGWQTQEKIKENISWKNIPIVFLTARTDHAAKKAGSFFADDYVEKPCKITDLKQKIDKILKT
jgi:CheY-like chemotaxis protein